MTNSSLPEGVQTNPIPDSRKPAEELVKFNSPDVPNQVKTEIIEEVLNKNRRAQELEKQIQLFKQTGQLDLPSLRWTGTNIEFGETDRDKSLDPYQSWQNALLNPEMIQASTLPSKSLATYGSPRVEVLEQTENSVTTKTTYAENVSITQTRRTRGNPEVNLIQSEESAQFKDILVPITSENELVKQKLTGTHVEEDEVMMGFNYSTGWVDEDFVINLLVIRLTFTFSYKLHFWLLFPVNMTIAYPQAVVPGHQYSVDVTLEPQPEEPIYKFNPDTLAYELVNDRYIQRKEFSTGFDYDFSFKVELLELVYLQKPVEYWYYCFWPIGGCAWPGQWKKATTYISIVDYRWNPVVDVSLSGLNKTEREKSMDVLTLGMDYETPINNRMSLINPYFALGNASFSDLLGLDIIDEFLSYLPYDLTKYLPIRGVHLNPNIAMIADEKITTSVKVLPSEVNDFAFHDVLQWGADTNVDFSSVFNSILEGLGQLFSFQSLQQQVGAYNQDKPQAATKSLPFRIANETTSSHIRVEVDDFRFYPRKFYYNPHLTFTSGDFWGGGNWSLRIPTNMAVITSALATPQHLTAGQYFFASDYVYSSQTLIKDGNYDFDVDITPLPITNPLEPSYRVDLRSLGDREDFIALRVLGIPQVGSNNRNLLQTTFHPNAPAYAIRPDVDISMNESVDVIIQGNKSIIITLKIPKSELVGVPRTLSLTLAATSQAKQYLAVENPTVEKNFALSIPQLDIMGFWPDRSISTRIKLHPGQRFSLSYAGENNGNFDNIHLIQAKLYSDNSIIFEKNNSHAVERYKTDIYSRWYRTNTYSGIFSFTYAPTDVYPYAGNYSLDILAYSRNGTVFYMKTSYIVQFLPDYNVTTNLSLNNVTMFADYEIDIPFSITNHGNAVDSYQITADGWTQYLNYTTRIENLSVGGTYETFVKITIPDPSIVPVQIHNFRLIVQSEGDSQVYAIEDVSVDFLELDLTPPGLAAGDWYQGQTLVFPFTNLSLGPAWAPIDDTPDNGTYAVFVNNSLILEGSWSNGDLITLDMRNATGYNEGVVFNVTTVITDISGNKVIDQVWVQIMPEDQRDPDLGDTRTSNSQKVTTQSLGNVSLDRPVNWVYPITLTWEVIEDFILNLTYFLNDTLIPSEDYLIWRTPGSNQFNITHTLMPGALLEGLWNLTLVIQDMNGHNVSKSLFLDIVAPDTVQPAIAMTPQTSLSQGIGETIIFEASDTYPHHWELWIDGKMQKEGPWGNNNPVDIPIDDLPLILGINTLELRIFDLAGNNIQYSWSLTLTDGTSPTIQYQPIDVVAYEHDLSQMGSPYWIVKDLNPNKYSIYLNGTVLETGVWSNSNNTFIIPQYKSTNAGTYVFEASFNDTSGNTITSAPFILTIKDVIAPQILPITNFVYEPNYVANWFEFHIDETNPASYSLYHNDVSINNGSLHSYYQKVLVDLEFLTSGAHTFRLEMTDKFGNIGQGSVQVVALDFTPPSIAGSSFVLMSEGSLGNNLTWTIFENNPQSYSIYRNGTQVDSGTLNATGGLTNLTYGLDSLELGFYEFVLTITDDSGQTNSVTSFVQVQDLSIPQIKRLGDYIFQLGNPNANIVWEVSENHPSEYEIQVDGSVVHTGPWTSNTIELSLVGFAKGSYLVKLILTDESGNIAIDEMTVVVEDVIITETGESTSEEEQASFGNPLLVIFALITFVIFIKTLSRTRRPYQ
jgi:hypothetical protein